MSDDQNTGHPSDVPPAPPSATVSDGGTTSDERNLAVLAHILGIFTYFVGALVIWLIKKDSSDYLNDQGREALNFQITVMIAWVVSGLLTMVAIGCIVMPVVFVLNLVFCIMGAVAASRGERYRYPMCLRLLN